METLSELRQAHRTAALIAGGLITGLVVALPAFRRALLRRRPDDTRATAIARLTLTDVAVGGWAEWLAAPAPRP